MMNATRMAKIDGILFKCEACYPSEFDSNSLDIWHETLAEFDLSEISAAFAIHIKTSKFLPRISEIIDIINNNQDSQITIESRAQQQWREVMTAVRQRGQAKGPPHFTDPITRHLVKAQFTWIYLCGFEEKDLNWEEKRWCSSFELASEIDLDQLRIESKESIKKLIQPIGGIG